MISRINRILSIIILLGILLGSALLVQISLSYLNFDPHYDFLETKQFIYHIRIWRWSFYVHVFLSFLLLLGGIIQFLPFILRKFPRVHRISGYIYFIVLIFLSGPAALIMSLYANGGIWAQISFTTLSIVWIGSTILAYIYVRKKNYLKHGNWLLRSYALTLSAITLRLYSFLIAHFHIDLSPKETYVLISYINWIPNLLIAEILIRRGYVKSLLNAWTQSTKDA
ncbi:MAG: DUF2306 domain-containing protein [Bacteroidetes bacterium]|nr:MAG: DUF2306 domain-containing protein [Bacteroidota bacterium]